MNLLWGIIYDKSYFWIIREEILDSEMAYSISDACIQMVEDSQCENELLEAASAFCLPFVDMYKKERQSIIQS